MSQSLPDCGSLFNLCQEFAFCISKRGRCLRRTRFLFVCLFGCLVVFFKPHFKAVNLRHNEVLVGDSVPVCCYVSW